MYKRYENPRNLLQLALDVHMTANGSMERSRSDQRADIAEIEGRLVEWHPSPRFTFDFDQAVRNVLLVAVREGNTALRNEDQIAKDTEITD